MIIFNNEYIEVAESFFSQSKMEKYFECIIVKLFFIQLELFSLPK